MERLRGNGGARTGRVSGWAGGFMYGRVGCFIFRSDLCLLTEFTLNGATSAGCDHFMLNKYKTFSVLIYSYINTSDCVYSQHVKREIVCMARNGVQHGCQACAF